MRAFLWRLCLLGAAFAGGATASSLASAADDEDDAAYRSLGVFARVLHYVENNYVREVSTDDLIYASIRGMLANLDPNSAFLDPEQYAATKDEAQGEFGGIGVELVRRAAGVLVVERYEGSPAVKAGLRIDDMIIAVDGRSLAGRSLADAVARIKGPAGTTVRLTVVRGREGLTDELPVRRERIRVESVTTRRWPDGIGYVRIRMFTRRTYRDLERGLVALHDEGPLKGLVLDLRDNPGGLVGESVRVADTWLRRGVIVSTQGRRRTLDVERAHPRGTEPPYPMVVLVNGGTASAAEIVTGALQDHRRATIMGTQTFGKGSVQTVIELEDGSALKLTVARYLTPGRRSISGVGITPDRVVPRREDSEVEGQETAAPFIHSPLDAPRPDHQLMAALDTLRERLRERSSSR